MTTVEGHEWNESWGRVTLLCWCTWFKKEETEFRNLEQTVPPSLPGMSLLRHHVKSGTKTVAETWAATVQCSDWKRWTYGTSLQQPYFFLCLFNDTLTNAWVTYHQGTVRLLRTKEQLRGSSYCQFDTKKVLLVLSRTDYGKRAGNWTRDFLNIKHYM